mmetsp:Transcript_75898/g.126358  ORF Transcript_75898/g.126358 Transcript_75898/m.126358 type:complete len:91 (-) Transcript_75898:277-549(-)
MLSVKREQDINGKANSEGSKAGCSGEQKADAGPQKIAIMGLGLHTNIPQFLCLGAVERFSTSPLHSVRSELQPSVPSVLESHAAWNVLHR